MEWYSEGYAWSVKKEERVDIDIGNDKKAGSIRRTVNIAGNTREVAVAYADRPAERGEQWIIILGYNQGRYTNIDAELNELTTALVGSF